MVAGSILPVSVNSQGELVFLFGKENKYEDSASGFSDFGGGTDNTESFLETAIREGGEELTGFLGSSKDIKKLLKKTYKIDHKSEGHSTYRMHIFSYPYDPMLEFYYNNNQRFLQKKLDPEIIKKSKIFEKEEIRWVCIDDLKKMRPKFRSYFQHIVDDILSQRNEIHQFISSSSKKTRKNKK